MSTVAFYHFKRKLQSLLKMVDIRIFCDKLYKNEIYTIYDTKGALWKRKLSILRQPN